MPLITTSSYNVIPTNFTLSDVSYVQFFDANPQNENMRAMHFKPDGTKMFVLDALQDRVHEYNLT